MDPFRSMLANVVTDENGKLKSGIDIASSQEIQTALTTMLGKLQQQYLATLAAEQKEASPGGG